MVSALEAHGSRWNEAKSFRWVQEKLHLISHAFCLWLVPFFLGGGGAFLQINLEAQTGAREYGFVFHRLF